MWGLTKGVENLPVSIKHELCKFGRMKRFQPYSAIVSALKESKFLEVSGSEGEEKVKRKTAYDPTIPKSKSEARSVYVKGFGDEDPSSQFDIEAFFAPYGPTNSVRLRRTDDKLFKGSVFVEFQDEDIAKKFLELDPKPLWKGKHILKVMSKTAYVEMKNEEIRDGKTEAKPHRDNDFKGRGRGRGRGRGENRVGRGRNDRDRGDRDPDDWKKRREEDRASGFKDNRRGDRNNDRNDRRGNNRDRGGRGGRGRRDDRGPRNNDRNREREDKNK
jgi:lupus La protein